MRCPTCGAETTKGARFCRACGALLVTNPEKTAANDAVSGGTHPRVAPTPPPAPAPVPVYHDERWAPEPQYPPHPKNQRLLAVAVGLLAIAVIGVGAIIAVAISRDHKTANPPPIADATSTTHFRVIRPPTTPPTRPPTTPATVPPTVAPSVRPGAEALALVNEVLLAEVDGDWETARIYDILSNQTDEKLDDDYADLRNQRAYPAGDPILVQPGVWRVRFTLVAHDVDNGSRYTFAVCELWDVNVRNRTIVAVDRHGQILTAKHPGDLGWHDPPDAPTCT